MSIFKNQIFLIALLIMTMATVTILYFYHLEDYIVWISTLAEVTGLLAIWLEFSRSRSLNEATFIMQLNQTFIVDDELGKLEYKLEQYRRCGDPVTIENPAEHKALLNYLAFQEGIAMLVASNVLSVETIDAVFSKRFFLIMNNPVIQDLELIPDWTTYRTCYLLYQEWYHYRKKKNLPILLEEHSLHKVPHFEEVVRSAKNHL